MKTITLLLVLIFITHSCSTSKDLANNQKSQSEGLSCAFAYKTLMIMEVAPPISNGKKHNLSICDSAEANGPNISELRMKMKRCESYIYPNGKKKKFAYNPCHLEDLPIKGGPIGECLNGKILSYEKKNNVSNHWYITKQLRPIFYSHLPFKKFSWNKYRKGLYNLISKEVKATDSAKVICKKTLTKLNRYLD